MVGSVSVSSVRFAKAKFVPQAGLPEARRIALAAALANASKGNPLPDTVALSAGQNRLMPGEFVSILVDGQWRDSVSNARGPLGRLLPDDEFAKQVVERAVKASDLGEDATGRGGLFGYLVRIGSQLNLL